MSLTSASEGAPEQTVEVPADPPPIKFRYAVKTALSLTLAYLLPMALGWPQPQTAATTVMLIAATGLLSESLQKGVLRVLGTVAGAVIGLTLIALFPQDRMVYLLAVSIVVAAIIYLYNAYQGDSTVFMLTAVVTLMVFNGGDADGAFLYGVERALMTAFGVIVYTLVATFLWPIKTLDNTRNLASVVAHGYARAFDLLLHNESIGESALDEQLAGLLSDEEAFHKHFSSIKNSAPGVADYLPEWYTVVSCYEELEATLVPALTKTAGPALQFDHYIANYEDLINHVKAQFEDIDSAWRGRREEAARPLLAIEYKPDSLLGGSHLIAAAIASRAELIQTLQEVLQQLRIALDSLLFDHGNFKPGRKPLGKPTYIWLDLENLKTAVRAFSTFWIAAVIWILFNPPGGYTFVILSTVFIPLVSYTPVTPKMLFVLFTLGFLFAVPAYVFLLPQLTHWAELSIFLFTYAFIGFYVFQGPVSIFFLLGLFTLGIQNTMSYNFNGIMLIVAMFYMICAMQIIATHFPFGSKPERIYRSVYRRFFLHAAKAIRLHSTAPARFDKLSRLFQGNGAMLLSKLQTWGAQIDPAYFTENSQQHIAVLNRACTILHGQLQTMALRRKNFSDNPLIEKARRDTSNNGLANLCDAMAIGEGRLAFEQMQSKLSDVETRLDELLGNDYLQRYDRHHLAQFYLYLNLQASIHSSLRACQDAHDAMHWPQLGESRF